MEKKKMNKNWRNKLYLNVVQKSKTLVCVQCKIDTEICVNTETNKQKMICMGSLSYMAKRGPNATLLRHQGSHLLYFVLT